MWALQQSFLWRQSEHFSHHNFNCSFHQESPVMLIYQEPIGNKLVVKKCICYKELKKRQILVLPSDNHRDRRQDLKSCLFFCFCHWAEVSTLTFPILDFQLLFFIKFCILVNRNRGLKCDLEYRRKHIFPCWNVTQVLKSFMKGGDKLWNEPSKKVQLQLCSVTTLSFSEHKVEQFEKSQKWSATFKRNDLFYFVLPT